MKTPAAIIILVAFFLTPLSSAVWAADDAVFTVDFPFDASQPLPSWMHGAPISVSGEGTRVAFQLSPPPDRDVLVHLVFDGVEKGGLRVEWMRDGQNVTETIAENLGEGLGAPSQRPLLISASRLGGPGTLIIQGSAGLRVQRIKFEWVSERTLLASSSRFVPVVLTASRLTLGEADVGSGERPALQDEWRDRVVRAVLTEKVEILTPSLELITALEKAPNLARFEASVVGVYLDQEVWIIVNGQELGPLAIEVPTLEDPGHLRIAGREVEFAGWRHATAYIPSALLLPGDNSILLELRSPVNARYHNRAYIREAILELAYPPPQREPDLTLPVADVPIAETFPEQNPPPPLAPTVTEPGPADALQEFWRGNNSL